MEGLSEGTEEKDQPSAGEAADGEENHWLAMHQLKLTSRH